eukprot:UN02593
MKCMLVVFVVLMAVVRSGDCTTDDFAEVQKCYAFTAVPTTCDANSDCTSVECDTDGTTGTFCVPSSVSCCVPVSDDNPIEVCYNAGECTSIGNSTSVLSVFAVLLLTFMSL